MKSQAGPARRAMRYRKFANRAKIHQAVLKEGKDLGEHRKPILASMKEHVGVVTVSNGG
jgi:aspartyl/asparaginyl beta-hydroxylase (cupin superfamily)